MFNYNKLRQLRRNKGLLQKELASMLNEINKIC